MRRRRTIRLWFRWLRERYRQNSPVRGCSWPYFRDLMNENYLSWDLLPPKK